MKILTVLVLLLSLVLPAGQAAQAMAAPAESSCALVDDSGNACCPPTGDHCCCHRSDHRPAPPPQPLPLPASGTTCKDIAASLPALLVLAELPRLSDSTAKSVLSNDRKPLVTALPVRLCVLRCSLIL